MGLAVYRVELNVAFEEVTFNDMFIFTKNELGIDSDQKPSCMSIGAVRIIQKVPFYRHVKKITVSFRILQFPNHLGWANSITSRLVQNFSNMYLLCENQLKYDVCGSFANSCQSTRVTKCCFISVAFAVFLCNI